MPAKNSQREISIFAHWTDFSEPKKMGVLSATASRGKEIFSFEYDQNWLGGNYTQILDPDLLFFKGPQYLGDTGKSNFGLFLDSSPDRWGRLLMKRREAALARKEKRSAKKLLESDFLLGVHDEHRMGALRFKTDLKGNFLDDNKDLACPPLSSLRELEHASLQIERDDATDDPEYLKWLQMLMSPGSSLGGARPKASVKDKFNHQWIAKFPSRFDEYDMAAWEFLANQLAIQAGLNVAKGEIKKFSSHHHTYLTKRFDRTDKQKRIHFASAMTMLGYNDGDSFQDGVSYLEIAEFLQRSGANVKDDLEELWKRIVFNICISNSDDHLRNHGFLLEENGWRLSPAFDINPIPNSSGLKLNINEDDNSLDLALAKSVIKDFRVSEIKADAFIKEIVDLTQKWRGLAKKLRLPKSECDYISSAFEHL